MVDAKKAELVRRIQQAALMTRNAMQETAKVMDEVKEEIKASDGNPVEAFPAELFSDYVAPEPEPGTPPAPAMPFMGMGGTSNLKKGEFLSTVTSFDLNIAYLQGEERAHEAPPTNHKAVIYRAAAIGG